MAVDMRTGSNAIIRVFNQPHRFIEQTGDCHLDVEDSNPSAIEGLLGPLGEGAEHVVVPVR